MELKSQKRGCRRSKNTTAGGPCGSRPRRETDPKDAPITIVKSHPITAEHNSVYVTGTHLHHRLKKTSSMLSKRREPHQK